MPVAAGFDVAPDAEDDTTRWLYALSRNMAAPGPGASIAAAATTAERDAAVPVNERLGPPALQPETEEEAVRRELGLQQEFEDSKQAQYQSWRQRKFRSAFPKDSAGHRY